MYDRLLTIDHEGEIRPMLATEWAYSADGTALDLTLQQGVTFSDGAVLDAAAAKASLERAMNLPGSTVAPRLAAVESVEVVNESRLRLVLNRPDATLLSALGQGAGVMISPNALQSPDLATKPVGSGAYQMVEFRPGDRVVFERAPGEYWDPDAAQVARLEVIGIGDNDTRLNALRSGQIDLMYLKADQVAQGRSLTEGGELSFYSIPGPNAYGLYLNLTDPALADLRVRQALQHAIDRTAIAEGLLEGAVTPAWQLLGPEQLGFDLAAEARYPFDPERARRLLAEAGYANGLTLQTALLQSGTPNSTIGLAVQGMLAEVGVTVPFQEVDSRQFYAMMGEPGWAVAFGSTGSYSDSSTMVQRRLLNPTFFPSGTPPEFTELAERAADGRLGEQERDALLREISRTAVEEAWLLPTNYVPTMYLASANVVGVDRQPLTTLGVIDARYVAVTG
jgi:peptide/nickel transport system substrate-binding protein